MNNLENTNLDRIGYGETRNSDCKETSLQLNKTVISSSNTGTFDLHIGCKNTSIETGTGFACPPPPSCGTPPPCKGPCATGFCLCVCVVGPCGPGLPR